jgi:hypothetical protein
MLLRVLRCVPRRLDFPTRHTADFDDLDRRASSFVFLLNFPRNTQTASQSALTTLPHHLLLGTSLLDIRWLVDPRLPVPNASMASSDAIAINVHPTLMHRPD